LKGKKRGTIKRKEEEIGLTVIRKGGGFSPQKYALKAKYELTGLKREKEGTLLGGRKN